MMKNNLTTARDDTTRSLTSGQLWLLQAIAIVLLLLVGGIYSWLEVRSADQVMREQLLCRARMMARSIDVSWIRMLAGNDSDLDKPRYLRLKEQFVRLKKANHDLRFIYLIGRKPDGTVFFFMDNEPESSPDYVHPGQIYHDVSPSFRQAMETGQECVDGPIKDHWGVWISALALVRDSRTGEAVAGLGADIDVAAWNASLTRAAVPGILGTLAMLVWLLFLFNSINRGRHDDGGIVSQHGSRSVVLFIGGGVILSLFIAWRVHEAEHLSRHEIFRQLAISETERLAGDLESIHSVELEGLAGLFECSEEVTVEEFERYSRHLTRNPLVSVWCLAEAVDDTERARFEEASREWAPGFRVWQFGSDDLPEPARGRKAFFPVVYFAPAEGNEKLRGYDLGSEPERHGALHEAMLGGLPTATRPTVDFRSRDEQKSIVICHPISDNEATPRMNRFALAEINALSLFKVDTRKYDTINMSFSFLSDDGQAEVLASMGKKGRACESVVIQRPVLAFGKVFLLTARPGLAFMDEYPAYRGAMTLAGGVILTVAVAIIFRLLQRRKEELEQLVYERTAKLQESESLFNQLAEHSRTVFWECDIRGVYTYASPSSASVYGYKPEELVGRKTLFDLWPEAEQERLYNEGMAIFEKNKEFIDFINPIKTKAGEIIQVAGNGIAKYDQAGNIIGCRGFDRDVTERERIVEDLKNSRIEAESASRAKSEFLTNMSHEVRTPISGIIGATELLRNTEMQPDQQEYLGIINASARLLLNIVDELLDFAEISAGRVVLKQASFNPRSMLNNLRDGFSMAAGEKGIRIECHVSPEIPSLLNGDEAHLRQALLNLLGNAVKFTKAGKVEIRVATEAETGDAVSLRFSVRDTGVGIAKEQQQKLFKAFFQVDSSTSRRHGGTGLGLAISYRLVELMGGHLSFVSEIGVGSEFFFTLRFEKQSKDTQSDEALPNCPQDSHPNTSEAAGSPGKVLVVEDNPVNQRVLLAMLDKIGLAADVAANGVEALRALAVENYVLVLMDIQMPVMDGLEAAEKIRDQRTPVLDHEIPIIAVTAHATSGYREKCMAVGMNDYLTKPVTLDKFRETLNRWLTT